MGTNIRLRTIVAKGMSTYDTIFECPLFKS